MVLSMSNIVMYSEFGSINFSYSILLILKLVVDKKVELLKGLF